MITFVREAREWGLRTAVWNARFRLGWVIGGFKSASR